MVLEQVGAIKCILRALAKLCRGQGGSGEKRGRKGKSSHVKRVGPKVGT